MKKTVLTIAALALAIGLTVGTIYAQPPGSNYNEQGGLRTVIGGSLDVVSGGDLDIESGGSLKIAGTAVTASAAALNALATGAPTFSGDVTLDDGVTASPSLVLKDATDETGIFSKVDAGNLTVTTVAGDGFQILTGNLIVGNGTPGVNVPNGEDLYVEGTSEFDSNVQVDATLTATNLTASTLALAAYGKLTPTDVAGTEAEGNYYWDDSENGLKVYSGAGWVLLGAAGAGSTLDQAYDLGGAGVGRTITADTGAVVITNTDADAAFVLSLTPTPSAGAASGGLQITSGANATEDSLQIVNSGTGDDIQAGAGAFKVSKLGAVNALSFETSAGATVGTTLGVTGATTLSSTLGVTGLATLSSGAALDNGATITNALDGTVLFTEGGEDLGLAFTSNTVSLSSSTGVDTLALGTIDDVTGIGSLAFDAAASTVTLAADGAADDLTVAVTGAQNASLVFYSEGTSNDALQIYTTAGGIDITNGGAASGEDLDIVSTNASINFTAGENVADSVVWTLAGGFDATITGAATQDFDFTNNGGSFNVTATEDVADAMVFTAGGGVQYIITGAATQDFVVTNTGGSNKFVSTEAAVDSFEVDTEGGVQIACVDDFIVNHVSHAGADDWVVNQTGAFDASIIFNTTGTGTDAFKVAASAGGVDIDGVADVNITCASAAGGDDFNIIQTGAFDASIHLEAAGTGADAIALQSPAGGLDIDAKDDIIITCASSAGADDLRIIQTGAFDASISLEAAGTGTDAIRLQSPAGGLDIDAKDDINITLASNAGADDFIIALTGATDSSILLQSAGTGADAIGLSASAGSITLAAASGDINVEADLDVAAGVDVIGDGSGKIGGMMVNLLNDINGETVTISQAGYTFTNTTDTDGQAWVLPAAATCIGAVFGPFAVTGSAHAVTIDPDGVDQIILATDAGGDRVSCATVGSSISLESVAAGTWIVHSIYGTWTDAN